MKLLKKIVSTKRQALLHFKSGLETKRENHKTPEKSASALYGSINKSTNVKDSKPKDGSSKISSASFPSASKEADCLLKSLLLQRSLCSLQICLI